MRLIRSWIITVLAILAASWLMPGSFQVDSTGTAVIAAVVLGFLNWTVKPILHILSLPINILTLGLFSLVINGIIISILAWLMAGMWVSGLPAAILVALVISIVNSILDSLTGGKKR